MKMKTATDWLMMKFPKVQDLNAFVRAIQLDAYKAGMFDAAKTALIHGDRVGNYWSVLHDKIIEALNKKTVKNLH